MVCSPFSYYPSLFWRGYEKWGKEGIFLKINYNFKKKMNLSSLVANIAKKLDFHNSRRHTFQEMALGMIAQHNVQHHALVQNLAPKSSFKSKLERARRFFKRTRYSSRFFRKGAGFKRLEGCSKNGSHVGPHKLEVWLSRYQLSRSCRQSWANRISFILDASRSPRKLWHASSHGHLKSI